MEILGTPINIGTFGDAHKYISFFFRHPVAGYRCTVDG